MSPIPDFRLYHSNALDVLAELLADELRKPLPGQSILTPDTILIPQAAMRRWLQATLAEQYGVAANLQFLTPGEFIAHALAANLPGARQDLSASALHWQVYAALGDGDLMQHPAMLPWQGYLEAQQDPLRAWALAGELASIFEKYQAWRRDWLLGWEDHAPANDPQAILWQHIAQGRQHRARRIEQYLARFSEHEPPQGLPRRLFVFATLNISPDVLRVIATQARVGALHFYLPTPTRAYWGDLPTLSRKLRSGAQDAFAEDTHPLLAAWGAAGRDFMAVLGGYEVVHPRGEIEAYVEPDAQPARLLHRIKTDLFHGYASPGFPLRQTLDPRDASLQIHACHTRLRELQVLHDQLRALLDDPTFDPPLQPRQIAVLAPDIDDYAPYLPAVFGAGEQPLPWTLADASPLQAEPLADLFLQLIHLPVSRFGLNEILDLIAGGPLQQALGLDGNDVQRLHDWLYAAGARWGLDGHHRQQHGAPQDDAYTWQFAFDRLILGHASGSDDDVAGVAPWPDLEGSAISALNALVAVLRVLARHSMALGEAMPPAHWRERLLALLQAVLPPTLDAGTQRTLGRLHRLIHAFAEEAANAGFSDAVPAEVVRAHFKTVLSEADTRAPLLTGGISFARMVPLRLLPFRVICILGMNDGDYPRRDPAAGLNRLANALVTAERRPGDRSIRDDDRFLFLQLFSAAQEVFYLSYLGADARDGSTREPSVLLRDLMEAAAAQHQDPAQVRKRLTVHHPLQPFSPAAFGDEESEPRRFSYQMQWHPAAGQAGAPRQALGAWLAQPLPEPAPTDTAILPLDALRRFLSDPAGQFLHHRLCLRLGGAIAESQDIEPLTAPTHGLERYAVQQQMLAQLLQGADPEQLYPRLRARALVPSGALGVQQCRALAARTGQVVAAFKEWHDGEPLCVYPCATELHGTRIHARIDGLHPQGLVRLDPGSLGAAAAIRNGLDWLLMNAAGYALPLLQFGDAGDGDFGPHLLPALACEDARAALARLLHLRTQGLGTPLLFAPYTGWEIWTATPEQRAAKARLKWYGSEHGWGESSGEALQLLFRGQDPFASEHGTQTFIDTSLSVFSALREGRASP